MNMLRKSALRARLMRASMMVITTILCAMIYQPLSAQDTVQIGTGSAANPNTEFPCPLQDYWEGSRAQYLYLASELQAQCVPAGYITGIAFQVSDTSSGAFPEVEELTIKIGTTSISSLPSAYLTGATTVYGSVDYLAPLGMNYFTFSSPFYWNGSDNIFLEVCNGDASNGTYTSYTTNNRVLWSTGLSFDASRVYYADNGGNLCGTTILPTSTNTSTNRPVTWFVTTTTVTTDLTVTNIALSSACTFSTTEPIGVSVTNLANTVNSFAVYAKINGGSPITLATGVGPISPCSTIVVNSTLNLSSYTSASVEAYVVASGDQNTGNDTAQVSVQVQMSGDFTIGGASPDYATFAAAFADLNSMGVCGPTTFHVRSGTYNETLVLDAIPGSSSTNLVTFIADTNNSTTPIVTSSTIPWRFNATSWVTIDGLQLQTTGATYVVQLTGFNRGITIQNSILNGYLTTSTSSLYALVYQSTSTVDYTYGLTLDNNVMNYGSFGLYFYGATSAASYNHDLAFRNNTLTGTYYMGVYSLYTDTSWVTGNTINMANSTTTQYGIYFSSGTYANAIGNKVTVSTTTSGYGLYSTTSSSSTTVKSWCANNMVSVVGGTTERGIYIGASNWKVMYNSVRSASNNASLSYSSIYLSGSNNELYNNLAHQEGLSYACYGTGTGFVHNNNVFYAPNGIVSNFTLGSNEYNTTPGFNSSTDLYIALFTDGYDGGTPISGITTDIDGNARDLSTPDMGASEYDLPENDAGIVALNNPISPITAGSNNVQVAFYNFGIMNIDTVHIDWEVNSSAQSDLQWTGSLAPGNMQSSVSLGNYNFPSGFSTIKAWTYGPNNETDANSTNDTMEFTVCTGLVGSFTLGGSSADFASFAEAISVLQTCGVAGPVVIHVDSASGPYNEQVQITGQIPGATTVNTVTFTGAGAELTWNAQSTNPAIITLDGTRHLVFDSLRIKSTNTTYGYGVRFTNQADSNVISNCWITVPYSTSTLASPIVFSGSATSYTTVVTGGAGNYNLIENNRLRGGYFGIVAYSTASANSNTANQFLNNTIDGTYYYGAYLRYCDLSVFNGNDVSRLNAPTVTTYYGAYIYYCSGGVEFKNNRIHDAFPTGSGSGYGLYLYNCPGTSLNHTVVENNIFYNLKNITSTAYGIFSYLNSYTDFRHNTIDMYDPNISTTSTGYAVYFSSTHGTSTFKNNIVRMFRGGTGTKYNIYMANTQTTFAIDHNVYWNDTLSTTSYIGYYSGNQAELANWQSVNSSAYDQNGAMEDPAFVDASTGDLTPLSLAIDDMGTPVGVLTDIDGATRSATTPDVGAIEFDGVSGDLAAVSAEIIRQNLCYNTDDTIALTLTNVVGSTVTFSTDSLMVSWLVDGPVVSSGTFYVNSGTLGLGSTMTVYATGADLSLPGTYTLHIALDTNITNGSTANDTLENAFSIEVDSILTISPYYSFITSPYVQVELQATSPFSPGSQVLLSEITQYRFTTGQPTGGWAAYPWINSDDNVEIIGAANASLEGYRVEVWNSAATTPLYSYTFGAGAALSASGVAYIGWGGTTNATYNYYGAGFASDGLSSSGNQGYVVYDPDGNISDVAVYGTTFTWSAQSGVTALDWSGNMTTAGTSTSGIRRINATDNNTGSDFVVTNASFVQDPGTYNSTVNTILAANFTGFDWSLNSSVLTTDLIYEAGPFTMDDTLLYIATFDSICGTYIDTAVIIVDLLDIAITASTNVSCNGGNDGAATVTASGGGTPYTYLWSNGNTTASTTGLPMGWHYVTVTDVHGYALVDSVSITEPTALGVALSSSPSTCGVANGSATVVPSGGTPSYNYLWSNASTNATAVTLPSGAYAVTVTDNNGCTAAGSVTVVDAGSPSISFSVQNVVCGGQNSGQVTPNVNGGTPPYNYLWSNAATTSAISNLAIGSYTLTVTDSANCVVFADTMITGNDTLEVVGLIDHVSCNGAADASVDITASGGVTNYTYLWSTGAVSQDVSSLAPATYTVTVTDNVGCTTTSSYTVTQPTVLQAAINSTTNASCFGLSNGSATVTPSGGTTAYSFIWNTGQISATAGALPAGTYTVTVSDANGCTTTAGTTITHPALLTIAVSGVTDVLCNGALTGGMTTTTAGGTATYSYLWNNAANTSGLTSVGAGTYTVTVTDNQGCTATTSGTIAQPTAVSSVDSIITPLCNGDSNASIYLTTGGGTGSLTYAWSSGQTSEDITGIPSGTYTVTVTDGNSCTFAFAYQVTQPGVLMWNVDNVEDAFCEHGSDGEVYVTVSGGTAPFDYMWSDSSTVEDASGLSVGQYGMTVTDTNGCVYSDSVAVGFINAAPLVEITGEDTICFGETTILSATTGYMTYAWSNGSQFPINQILTSGNYSVTITAFNGCQNWTSADVLVGDSIALTLAGTNVTCEGLDNGSATATVSGGFGTFTFAWSDGQTTANATNLVAGVYEVTVTDGIGCEASESADIDFDHTNPVISLGPDTAVCYIPEFSSYNSISLTPGTGFATYAWNTGETTASISTTDPGSYSVLVEDENGCLGTDTIVIDSVICLGIDAPQASAVISIYPNPTRGITHVSIDARDDRSLTMHVLNLQGQVVAISQVTIVNGRYDGVIDFTSYAKGVYMLQIREGEAISTTRVVVQ